MRVLRTFTLVVLMALILLGVWWMVSGSKGRGVARRDEAADAADEKDDSKDAIDDVAGEVFLPPLESLPQNLVDPPPSPASPDSPESSPSSPPSPKSPDSPTATEDRSQPPPWAETLAEEPQSHAAFRYLRMDGRDQLLSVEDVKRWLEPAGPGGAITPVGGARGTSAQLKGLFRFRNPWPEQAVLRIGLDKVRSRSIRLHVFHESSGVLLVNTISPRERWSAYLTQRESDTAMPDERYLASDDSQRAFKLRRQRDSPLELHWRDGLLRLVSGETTLLAAPLEGAPTDIFFEGTGVLYGLELRRCTSAPDLPAVISANPAPLNAAFQQDNWDVAALPEGATLKVSQDSVQLEANNADKSGWAACELPRGFYFVQMQIEGGDGSGVYLSQSGKPTDLVRLVRNQRDEQRLSLFRTNDQAQTNRNLGQWPQVPSPSIGPKQWVRLLAGPRTLHWWTSRDGKHWAAPQSPTASQALTGRHLGLFHAAKVKTKLTLSHIQRVPLPSLNAFAELATAGRPSLPPLEQPPGQPELQLPPWETALEQAAGAYHRIQDGRAWAKDYQTFYEGSVNLPLEQRQRLLVELSYLLAMEGDTGTQDWLLRETANLAQAAWDEKRFGPYSLFRDAYLRMYLPHSGFPPDGGYPPMRRLLDQELLGFMALRRWDELAEVHQGLAFYRPTDSQVLSPLLDWAGAVARRHLPSVAATRATLGLPLWIDDIDKSTFNAMVEFEGLLEAGNWDAAAKLAATVAVKGLAPHPRDGQLLLEFNARLRDACFESSELRKAMAEQAQDVAQLYVRRAKRANTAADVEDVARRFPATPAAAEAWAWLGDLALADGHWQSAVHCFREALREDPYAPGVEAKLQLALSLGGRADADWQPSGVVDWGDQLQSSEAKQLVEAVQKEVAGDDNSSVKLPILSSIQVTPQEKIEEPYGRDPRQQVSRFVNERQVDWAGRQMSSIRVGDRLIVCNRFQLAAFKPDTGERLWNTAEIKEPRLMAQRARDASLTPSRPATDGRWVAARLLYGAGAVLMCVDAQDGVVQWTLPPENNERWASDPVLHQGRMWVVRMRPPTDVGDVDLELVCLRMSDGQTLAIQRIGRVRQDWIQQPGCQLIPAYRGLLTLLDGVLIYSEPQGVRWVRRQPTPPLATDQRRPLEWIEPPRVFENQRKVIVRYAGLPLVQCLDVATGILQWEAIVPALASISAVHNDRFIVFSDEQLQCRDAHTGELIWSDPWQRRCRSLLVGEDRLVCLLQNAPLMPVVGTTVEQQTQTYPAEQPNFHLQWRRIEDGSVLETTPITQLPGKDPRVGPVIPLPSDDGYWLLYGEGILDATRTLLRLSSKDS